MPYKRDYKQKKMEAHLNQIKIHEKSIKLLNAIIECERRLTSDNAHITLATRRNVTANIWHWKNRVSINEAIKARLQNYYNKSFKI